MGKEHLKAELDKVDAKGAMQWLKPGGTKYDPQGNKNNKYEGKF